MRNAGDQTAEEIETKLFELGLKLGMLPVEA
jgi:DNA-directed RNA polymerase alpha subunit